MAKKLEEAMSDCMTSLHDMHVEALRITKAVPGEEDWSTVLPCKKSEHQHHEIMKAKMQSTCF